MYPAKGFVPRQTLQCACHCICQICINSIQARSQPEDPQLPACSSWKAACLGGTGQQGGALLRLSEQAMWPVWLRQKPGWCILHSLFLAAKARARTAHSPAHARLAAARAATAESCSPPCMVYNHHTQLAGKKEWKLHASHGIHQGSVAEPLHRRLQQVAGRTSSCRAELAGCRAQSIGSRFGHENSKSLPCPKGVRRRTTAVAAVTRLHRGRARQALT